MTVASDALARIAARAAHTAAALPPSPPPPAAPAVDPDAPPADDQRLNDLEAGMTDLDGRVAALEQAQIDQAVAEMDEMGGPGMAAALPELPTIVATGEPANA